MADLHDELEDLHVLTVRKTRERLEDPDCTSRDIQAAIALLKQNNITADLSGGVTPEMKTLPLSKLDFSALKAKTAGKVIPIVGQDQVS